MDIDMVKQDLSRRFAAPLPEFYCRRIIFWYDEEREFEDQIGELALDGVNVLKLTGSNTFAVKKQLCNCLLYTSFFRFYDTVHTFLDSSIRRVIERCQNAADIGAGIQLQDVDVLKLLYLVRYVNDDIPANVDNIVILMADDIRTDKIILRGKVVESLNRLMSQNYIGRSGETYRCV